MNDDKLIEDMCKAFVKQPPAAEWSSLSEEAKEAVRRGMRVALLVQRKKEAPREQ